MNAVWADRGVHERSREIWARVSGVKDQAEKRSSMVAGR